MARVLVIDDSEPVREVIGSMLSRLGHEPLNAADGEEGIATYEQTHPEAVLLDLLLPDVSGLEVLRRLREADPAIKVAMLTAQRERDTVLKALDLGARDYLTKPVTLTRLKDALERLLA